MSTWNLMLEILPPATLATLGMITTSMAFAGLVGLPLGTLLALCSPGHAWSHHSLGRMFYRILTTALNGGRSFPFAILLVVLIPLTRVLIGTSLGTAAAIVPLSVAALFSFAYSVEGALRSVDLSLLRAVTIMGATSWQLVRFVYLPEALPALVRATTSTLVLLVSYSAMAGLVGGGGLGKVAIQYGYYRFETGLMVATVLVLIALVQIIQTLGNRLEQALLLQRGKTHAHR